MNHTPDLGHLQFDYVLAREEFAGVDSTEARREFDRGIAALLLPYAKRIFELRTALDEALAHLNEDTDLNETALEEENEHFLQTEFYSGGEL